MKSQVKNINLLITGLVLSLFLASLFAPAAFADVRKADVVLGDTVEAQGLTVADCPSIGAEHAILMNESGEIYFERDADAQVRIASITKIMTAITALDSVPIETTITVSENAAYIGESTASLLPGDTMPLSEALKALLVPSGNDAAQAIAESIGAIMLSTEGGDASDLNACCNRFVDAMNAKSAELGMTKTLWTNPHGLDDEEFEADMHSTARDVATMSAYAMQKNAIRDITSQKTASCQIERGGSIITAEFESTDLLLGDYEGVCGIKTGFTDTAGACFAGACNRGEDIYAIVLNAVDEWERFDDVRFMWDWFYTHCIDLPLASSDRTTVNAAGETVPLVAEVPAQAWLDKCVEATLEDPNQTVRVFSIEGNVSQEVEYQYPKGGVRAGDVVGTITYKQRNEIVATANLVAARDLPGPNVFEMISIWWSRLVGGFMGDDGVADPKLYNQMPVIRDNNAL